MAVCLPCVYPLFLPTVIFYDIFHGDVLCKPNLLLMVLYNLDGVLRLLDFHILRTVVSFAVQS